jgi:prepilin-type processing-associated H-X9-DG protein
VIKVILAAAGLVLLAAILWPVFAPSHHGKHGQRDYRCMSNLKMLGLAVLMYARDSDQRLPPAEDRGAGGVMRWEATVYPYIKDWSLYHCPRQPGDWSWEAATPPPPSFLGYGANRPYLLTPESVALASVTRPPETILLADRDALGRDIHAPIAGKGLGMVVRSNVAIRHSGGANFIFADGHVKWMKADDAWSKDDTMWDLK